MGLFSPRWYTSASRPVIMQFASLSGKVDAGYMYDSCFYLADADEIGAVSAALFLDFSKGGNRDE